MWTDTCVNDASKTTNNQQPTTDDRRPTNDERPLDTLSAPVFFWTNFTQFRRRRGLGEVLLRCSHLETCTLFLRRFVADWWFDGCGHFCCISQHFFGLLFGVEPLGQCIGTGPCIMSLSDWSHRIVSSCGCTFTAASCISRFCAFVGDFPFLEGIKCFLEVAIVAEVVAHVLEVSAGSAVAAVAAKVWFHTAAAVRLTETSPLLSVSPSSLVSSPF